MALFVLLVEDNLDLSETITTYLEIEGMVCDYASNAEAGEQLLGENSYDVVVLDIMLPRMSGLQLCERLRQSGNDTPVLMLTARDTLEDKLKGFDSGTDDYLVKPFDLPELVVRIKSLSKRKSGQSKQLSYSDLTMDLSTATVRRDQAVLKLTPIGWKILEILLRNAPNPVTRQKLVQSVWGDDSPESNSLKVHLHKLRKQINESKDPALLHTVPNIGYAISDKLDHPANTDQSAILK